VRQIKTKKKKRGRERGREKERGEKGTRAFHEDHGDICGVERVRKTQLREERECAFGFRVELFGESPPLRPLLSELQIGRKTTCGEEIIRDDMKIK
jgi:hypothetical protein